MPPGTLYVVATPIGNLDDITLRAIEVLRTVALIACEDTRHTRVLLERHGIATKLVAFHKFNENLVAASLAARLEAGESIALVSDGGTPAISDPGYRLVREALDAGAVVTPVPGPSAFVAAVSASGLSSECVTFRGFLPHRSGERRRLILSIREEAATQVFYESPHRIVACLGDLAEILGARRAAVAREMTKRFETWYRGTLSEVAEKVAAGPVKGEFCLVIEGMGRHDRSLQLPVKDDAPPAKTRTPDSGGPPPRRTRTSRKAPDGADSREGEALPDIPPGPEALRALYERALASGLDRPEALRRAARACGLGRKEAYRLLHVE